MYKKHFWNMSSFRQLTGPCCAQSLVAQSCPAPCDPMDRSPPGSSAHGILQARRLEWAGFSSTRRFSRPSDWDPHLCLPHWQADSLPLTSGKPKELIKGDQLPFSFFLPIFPSFLSLWLLSWFMPFLVYNI